MVKICETDIVDILLEIRRVGIESGIPPSIFFEKCDCDICSFKKGVEYEESN